MTAASIMYLINVVIVLVGVIFTVVSIGVNHGNKKKVQRCKVLTKGRVVDMQREASTSNTDGVATFSWYPVYEYTADEHIIRKRSYFGQAKQAFYPGEEVEIYYNANDYNEFYVPKEHTGKLIMAFQIIGAMLLIIGVILFFVIKLL